MNIILQKDSFTGDPNPKHNFEVAFRGDESPMTGTIQQSAFANCNNIPD
jgi:hypothetical protein